MGEGWLTLRNNNVIWLYYWCWTLHHLIFAIFIRRKHYEHSLLNVTNIGLERDPRIDTTFYSLCLESELSTKRILSGWPSGRKCRLPASTLKGCMGLLIWFQKVQLPVNVGFSPQHLLFYLLKYYFGSYIPLLFLYI